MKKRIKACVIPALVEGMKGLITREVEKNPGKQYISETSVKGRQKFLFGAGLSW